MAVAFLTAVGDKEIWNYIKDQIIRTLKSHDSKYVYGYLYDRINSAAILYWMLDQEELMSINETRKQIASYAAILGDLKILNIMAQSGVYPGSTAIGMGSKRGHFNVLKWSIDHHLINLTVKFLLIYHNPDVLDEIHMLEIYEILYENDLLSYDNLQAIYQKATRKNKIEFLNWLQSLNSRHP